jgi:hypothetical protein
MGVAGDANTIFFHGIANGRRRKCSIFSLESEGGDISDPVELRNHIEGYYKNLFGSEERGSVRLQEDLWGEVGYLSLEEADSLIKPFFEEEIKNALEEMNSNSAPGPDGLFAAFYKTFWDKVKSSIIEMFGKFYREEMNLSRLNYGMISLILKIKEANNIKQFKPICLLGVDYKWITKVLTKRLTAVVDSVVSGIETTFIPGRNILEGVVILHETMHELKRRKKKGIILKLDFEKAYEKISWPFLLEVLERKHFPKK